MTLQTVRRVYGGVSHLPLMLMVALSFTPACQISNTLDPIDRPCSSDQPCGPGSSCDLISGRCMKSPADARTKDLGSEAEELGSEDDLRMVDRGQTEAGADLMTPDRVTADIVCPPGTTLCNGACVDLSADALNCGECSRICPANADRCEDSQCVCGGTSAPCGEGLNCVDQVCVCIVGGLCQGCCQGDTCYPPGAEQDVGRCGTNGATCAGCDDGQSCTTDQCLPTGGCENLPLPGGTPCDDGVACTHSDQCQGDVCGGVAYSCDGGPACTVSVCSGVPPPNHCTLSLNPGFCLIEGVCHGDGALNPDDACLQCSVAESTTSWVPESIITLCDPLTSAECAAGAGCYIVRGEFLDCVCGTGDQALGQPCDTSTECAPGLACYSPTSTPPGECQLLCDPLAGDCVSGQPCQVLNNYPTYGTCRD